MVNLHNIIIYVKIINKFVEPFASEDIMPTCLNSAATSTEQTNTEGGADTRDLRSFLGDSAYEMYRNGLIDVEWAADGTPKVVPVEEDYGFEY